MRAVEQIQISSDIVPRSAHELLSDDPNDALALCLMQHPCRTAYADHVSLALRAAAELQAVCPGAAARLADLEHCDLQHIVAWTLAVWPQLNLEEAIASELNRRQAASQ